MGRRGERSRQLCARRCAGAADGLCVGSEVPGLASGERRATPRLQPQPHEPVVATRYGITSPTRHRNATLTMLVHIERSSCSARRILGRGVHVLGGRSAPPRTRLNSQYRCIASRILAVTWMVERSVNRSLGGLWLKDNGPSVRFEVLGRSFSVRGAARRLQAQPEELMVAIASYGLARTAVSTMRRRPLGPAHHRVLQPHRAAQALRVHLVHEARVVLWLLPREDHPVDVHL